MHKITLIDPQETFRELLARELLTEGYDVSTFGNFLSMQKFFRTNTIDLAICASASDPLEQDFVATIARICRTENPKRVLVLAESIDAGLRTRLIKAGAAEVFLRQDDIGQFKALVQQLVRRPKVKRSHNPFANIIGEHESMQKLYSVMTSIAKSQNATVFIRGESGTGKELVARAIHDNSPNANQPFVEINCAALPEHLLESELFGYEKGAFTDARQTKKGLLELADWGTFFLDEIGDMNIRLQIKLVKAIEEKSFRRIGGLDDIKVSMRIMAATNRNIERAVAEKTFREDLYFRLDVLAIFLPPLRERGDDVILLANHFLERFNREHQCEVTGFAREALVALRQYPWPGNVRELKNAIERAVLLGRSGKITNELLDLGRGHLVEKFKLHDRNDQLTVDIPSTGISMDAVEEALLRKSLEMANGNKSLAARLLHLSRETFRYRLKKYRLS